MYRSLSRITPCIFSLLAAGAALAADPAPPAPGATGSKLAEGLDTYHFPITTSSEEAQAWFNQGLVLLYGFNHGEAIRAFTEAAARDPEAAMPWWGIAYANGMHINMPEMTEAQWQASHEAARKALSVLDRETPVETMLVMAVAARTAWPVPEAQRPYDEAFCASMEKVYTAFGESPDVAALYTESMMNLQPWDYWTEEKEPKLRGAEIVSVLEKGLAAHPDHPQLCHLYIHATEAGPDPSKAIPAAESLRKRVPGAGHLVHMPSHTFARVGRYTDAATANEVAVGADDAFFEVGTEPGAYYLYHAHNLHFLAFANMMEGRYEAALEAARRLEKAVPDPVLDQMAFVIEGVIPTTRHVMIRFGKWEDILAEPAPPEKRPVMTALHHYSRGIAFSALGRTGEAKAEIAQFEACLPSIPEDWWVFSNKLSDVLPIARHMLDGELAYREGRLEEAWAALEAGVAAEDKLAYDEPPGWMIPVRHAFGALLLEAGEAARAETLYREDQEDHPGNGWSLLGLKQALEAQGKHAEAAAYAMKLDKAWARLETRPTSSCLCATQVAQR
jgi:tetratricopeptide (TPR) repeat protein